MRSSTPVLALGFGLAALACQSKPTSGADSGGAAIAQGAENGAGGDEAPAATGGEPGTGEAPVGSTPRPFAPTDSLPPLTAKAPAGDCPELTRLYDDSTIDRRNAYEIALALRALACQPRLHTLPAEAVARELRTPKWMKVEFFDGGARIESERLPPAWELARMLGIDDPVARLEWQAYHQQWFLDTESSGKLAEYGPGKISVMVNGKGGRDDAPGTKVALAEDTKLRGVFLVAMPDSAVAMGPDREGQKQLVTAVKRMSTDAQALRQPPEAVSAKFGLDSERWQIAGASRSRGEVRTTGVSIDPQRTRIPADSFAAQLGLEGAQALNINREHDSWAIEVGGSTDIRVGDATISVRVRPADKSDRRTTLAGATVEFITLFPITPDE